MSTPPSPSTATAASTEALATTIANTVERQLKQYVASMTKEVEARLQANEQSTDAYTTALKTALEERLAEFAKHQQTRLNELQSQSLQSAAGSGAGGGVGFGGGIDSGELVTLREQIDSSSAAAHARIDELAKSSRRFDEQASALVQHVNDTSQALTQRMDEGSHALANAVEERFNFVRTALESMAPEMQRQLAEQATTLAGRVDFTENKITDRMLAMEERVNEQTGTKIAGLEATIGRIGSGFDEAIAALSQRMLELENSLSQVILHTNVLTETIGQVDA
ncbi:MAG: hypothetical protein HY826_03115, partial [Actinobacteria bacterium]|nr:hypothetical protein [Actinomycetota bacterium]